MKNFRLPFIMALALVIGVTSSCQKEKNMNPDHNTFAGAQGNSSMIVLGKQLENPYSVANMTKAKNNLMASKDARESVEEIEVTTTHLYIKFKPKNEEEFSLLKKDSTLQLFSYPMDYEIAKQGDYYHDPTIPDGQPTPQYTSVKVDKKINYGVDYEVLAHLFIPDEEQPAATNSRAASTASIEELVDEALYITGNLEEKVKENVVTNLKNAKLSWPKWRPSGRVTVWDDVRNAFVPVVDVEVRAKRWFTVHSGTTDGNGNYSCNGTFKRPADYSILWEKYHFSVRSGTFGQAEVGHSNLTGAWNPQFGRAGSRVVDDGQQYYALVFQGARDYYYGNRFGLASPPQNSTWHPQMKISADFQGKSAEKPSHAAMYARTIGVFPSLYVRRWEDRSDVVYAVTTHELAHSAHWDMDRDAFRTMVLLYGVAGAQSSEAVVESWANGVEWQFAVERYRNLFGRTNYNYLADNYQNQTIGGDPIYTSIVVDMIDDVNQRVLFRGDLQFPLDRVSGYSILQIEQGLRGAVSWAAWRNNIIRIHENSTENNLNELFANWYN